MNWSESLQLVVLPGVNPSQKMRTYYDLAYAHWENIWEKTLREVDGANAFFSDNFTRQDEVYALFIDLQCVAMVCHRFVDLGRKSNRKDSYFQAWPEETLDKLVQYGNRVLIGSQISVDPNYRGRHQGISLKDLVSGISMWRMRQMDIDALPGTMRADKNMQQFLYEAGAVPLQKGVTFHGLPADLVAFHPQVMPVNLPAPTEQLIETLWAKKKGTPPLLAMELSLKRKRKA